MCEVTRNNFDEVYPQLLGDLQAAHFIAFDAEYTALRSMDDDYDYSLFDGMPEYYDKLRHNAGLGTICQLGLSAFRWNVEVKEYNASVYNIYLCPRYFGSHNPEILCQASCVHFLAKHNFNFQKFLTEGVLYMSQAEAESAKASFLREDNPRSGIDDESELLGEVVSAVSAWRNDHRKAPNEEKEFHCQGLPVNYVMLCVVKSVKWVEVAKASSNQIRCRMLPSEERKDHFQQTSKWRSEVIDALTDELTGFSKIIQMLIDSKKPLVGHNCLHDLLKMHRLFLGPVPSSWKDFCSAKPFPHVYDTKAVTSLLRQVVPDKYKESLRKTGLEALYGSLNVKKNGGKDVPFILLWNPAHNNNKENGKSVSGAVHDAAFDSYMTGVCFIKLTHMAAEVHFMSTGINRCLKWNEQLFSVKSYANVVNIARANVRFASLHGCSLDHLDVRRPALLSVSVPKSVSASQLHGLIVRGFGANIRLSPFGLHQVATPDLCRYDRLLRSFPGNGPLRHKSGIRARPEPDSMLARVVNGATYMPGLVFSMLLRILTGW